MPRIVSTYKEEARKKVLETSLEVFKEKGFFKCTMDDIAEKLGISKGAIYQYFDSKEQLLVALYSTGPEVFRSYASASSKGTAEVVKAMFAEIGTRDNANLFSDFLAEASRNANLQKAIRENMERFDSVLVDLLKKRNPKMSPKETTQARGAATMLGMIFNGLWCWLVVGAPESEVKDLWGRAVDMLLAPYDRKQPTATATATPRGKN
jgi:AcrR family transcriptional regulator